MSTETIHRDHAVLSPSAAKRWLTCTPSARFEERILAETGGEETRSSYHADLGTIAHAVAEWFVADRITHKPQEEEPQLIITRMADTLGITIPAGDMDAMLDFGEDYAARISDFLADYPSYEIFTEVRCDLSEFVPESFGSIDCLVISEDTLHVIDYKYGMGVRVDAAENPQLRLYALGALLYTRFLGYEVSSVRMSIIQPRISAFTTDEMTAEDLLSWGESIKPAARLAFDGKGDFVRGDHCRFCRGLIHCKAQRYALASVADEISAHGSEVLPPARLAELLKQGEEVEAFIKAVRAHLEAKLREGTPVPGYKLVEGRSTRKWADEEGAHAKFLALGFSDEQIYERKLLGLTALTKLVGKKKFDAEFAPFLERSMGAPSMVSSLDPRPAFTPSTTDYSEKYAL